MNKRTHVTGVGTWSEAQSEGPVPQYEVSFVEDRGAAGRGMGCQDGCLCVELVLV